jgi:hypothetical protein
MLYRGDDPIQARSTKNRPVFGLGSSFGEPQLTSELKNATDPERRKTLLREMSRLLAEAQRISGLPPKMGHNLRTRSVCFTNAATST